jgi:putative peptidoglycan lipid II flippase
MSEEAAGTASRTLARQSGSAAAWTVVSRITGFLRIAAIGAVLGPTYLGNTFVATNSLPNLLVEMLTGSLLGTVLVPALVRALDAPESGTHADGAPAGGLDRARRLAGGYVGVVLTAFGIAALLGALLAPLIMLLLTAAVDDPQVAADQRRVGLWMLLLFLPQVPLYGLAYVGAAVQNARGRFALAAAAPVTENVALIATVGLYVVVYGSGGSLDEVGTGEIVLLGAGPTLAVALHAAVQCWGAWRTGISLRPRFAFRDPEIRELARASRTAMGQAGLSSLRMLGGLVVANTVAGGVVAYRLALNFFYLPIAVVARPLAAAFQPRLARLQHRAEAAEFAAEYRRAIALILFVTIPSAVAFAALAEPFARAASLGEMATADAPELVMVSLAALAAGVIGDSLFILATNAAYARGDVRASFRGAVVGTSVALAGMAVALTIDDDRAALAALGLSVSAGALAGCLYLLRRMAIAIQGGSGAWRPLLRAAAASLLMAGPAWLAAQAVADAIGGEVGWVVAALAAALVGGAIFLAVERALRSPELAFFTSALDRT